MGNERLSVWGKQVEKPFLCRTIQTFFPSFYSPQTQPNCTEPFINRFLPINTTLILKVELPNALVTVYSFDPIFQAFALNTWKFQFKAMIKLHL